MKQAFTSKQAFSPWVAILLGVPSALALTLTEGARDANELSLKLLIALVTHGFVVLVVMLIGGIRLAKWYRWWVFPVISSLLGLIRGFSAWYLSDLLTIPQQSLESRLLISGATWAILYPTIAYFFYLFLESKGENEFLRNQLARVKSQVDSLDQQRNWLFDARISGLNIELASKFVGLARRLNEAGSGPGSYREIATELREVSRNQVRPKSIEVYRQRIDLPTLAMEYLRTTPNRWLVSGAYVASAALNSLRVEGLTSNQIVLLVTGAAIWATLALAQKIPLLSNLVWLSAGLTTVGVTVLLTPDTPALWNATLSAAIWSQTLAITATLIRLTLSRQEKLKQQLEKALDAEELDVRSLTLELESKNIEIAKYLHAILQTRLMSYAMQLESGSITAAQLEQLTDLLANPMQDFELADANLADGLAELRLQWEPLVEIKFQLTSASSPKDKPTLQVIREAIANSVRHGLASQVTVEVADGKTRTVTVSDNGIGPRTGPMGLGTTIFNQLCQKWGLSRNKEGGATFSATL